MRHGGGTSQKQTLDAHLAHRYAADAGVQEPRGGVGTHFAHEGEFLFPADTVFLHFFSVRNKEIQSSNTGTKPNQSQLSPLTGSTVRKAPLQPNSAPSTG